MRVVCNAFTVAQLIVLAWVVFSWIRVSGDHPVGRIAAMLDRIVQPVVTPLRRVIPPVRIGAGYLDLSPLILIFGLAILRRLIC